VFNAHIKDIEAVAKDGEATMIHGKGPALIPNPTIRLPKNPA